MYQFPIDNFGDNQMERLLKVLLSLLQLQYGLFTSLFINCLGEEQHKAHKNTPSNFGLYKSQGYLLNQETLNLRLLPHIVVVGNTLGCSI